MIEAVNSVISNAPLLRGNAEQASSAQSFAADENQVPEVSQAPRAPFLSLVTVVDTDFDTAVYAFRDSDTGDVLRQFPTEQRLAALARIQQAVVSSGVGPIVPSSDSQSSDRASTDLSSDSVSLDLDLNLQTQGGSGLAESQAAAAALANTAAAAEPQIVSVSISA